MLMTVSINNICQIHKQIIQLIDTISNSIWVLIFILTNSVMRETRYLTYEPGYINKASIYGEAI